MISEKQISVQERFGQLVFIDRKGRELRRNTCKTVIPEGWTGSLEREEAFNLHGLYVARAIKMMFKEDIRNAKEHLGNLAINFRIEAIRKRNQQKFNQ